MTLRLYEMGDEGMLLVDVADSRREEDFFKLIQVELLRPSLVWSNRKNRATTNSKWYLRTRLEVPNIVISRSILFIFFAYGSIGQ